MRASAISLFILGTSTALVSACAGTPSDDGPFQENNAPVADAGEDQTVPWGRPVIASGSCTDADPEDEAFLVYQWDLLTWPTGSSIRRELIHAIDTPKPFFEPDVAGEYTLGLKCNDGEVDGALDLVVITVEEAPPNRPPVVNAGEDVTLSLGETIQLSVQASDPDGDTLTFAWTLVSKPSASALDSSAIENAGAPEASIVPDEIGTWVFEVTASDPRGGEACDQITVEIEASQPLDGELTVTVLDRRTLAPLAGVTIAVGNTIATETTAANGMVIYGAPGLTGPVDVTAVSADTVAWDHDSDPDTAEVTAPKYRVTSMTGVMRASITILLERSGASGRGRVVGTVTDDLFSRLPAVDPTFSMAGGNISGQFRLVLITPLLPLGESSVEVDLKNLMVIPASRDTAITLPENMCTDDPFLNQYASGMGREPGPNGEDPFTVFSLSVPSGTQQLVVLGGIGTMDLEEILPSVLATTGAGSLDAEIGVTLGFIDATTLFVGIITVEVPENAEVSISAQLASPEAWTDSFQSADFTSATEETTIRDPFDGSDIPIHRLRIFPEDTIEVTSLATVADPRVAANLPATSPYELLCGEGLGLTRCDPPNVVDLNVPESVQTDQGYQISLLYLRLPPGQVLAPGGGMALVSFGFTRTPSREAPVTELVTPKLDGLFSGLTYEVIGISSRGTAADNIDGYFDLQIGHTVDSASGLLPGARVSLNPAQSLPQINDADAGIDVVVLFEVENPNAPGASDVVIEAAHATVRGLKDGSLGPDLPSALTSPDTDAALRVLTFCSVERIQPGNGEPELLFTQPLWDVLFPGDATLLTLPILPAAMAGPIGSDSEVWARLSGYHFRGSFSYQATDPNVLAYRRRGVERDAWSFRWP